MQTFTLNDKEEKTFLEFCQEHRHPDCNFGAIGGHISVRFVCTSIGDACEAICSHCGATKDLTDYDSW